MPPSGNPNPPVRKSLLETLSRMEPNVEKVQDTRAAASIAISLKRIADALDRLEAGANMGNEYGETGYAALSRAITRGLFHGR